MVELVAVIVIIGILAVAMISSMNTSGYRGLEFHDKVVSALRYAQKTAVSHRRMVCVAFSNSTVTLTIAADPSGACNNPLNLPGGNSNVVQSGDSSNAFFTPSVPALLYFQSDGRGTANTAGTTIYGDSPAISGQTGITISGMTGYVQ